MGVPTSEVGYTSAMPRREDHEVHKDMWGIGGEEGGEKRVNFLLLFLYFGCTTNQRNILFGCLHQLLVQGHRGPLQCFLESLQFTVDALVQGDSRWGVFIVEEVERAGSKLTVEVTEDSWNHRIYWMLPMSKLPELGSFSSTAKMSSFL